MLGNHTTSVLQGLRGECQRSSRPAAGTGIWKVTWRRQGAKPRAGTLLHALVVAPGWALGLDLSCTAAYPNPQSRSRSASPAPAATTNMAGSVSVPSCAPGAPNGCCCHQPHCPSPRCAGTPIRHTAQGPRWKYVIQTQKRARVSIGIPNVFRQTWVCLLFTYSNIFTPAGMYIWIYLPGHIF